MQTISRKIKVLFMLACVSFTIIASADGDILQLPSHGSKISLRIHNQHLVAKQDDKNLAYQVANEISKHLTSAYDARLISDQSGQSTSLFIVLSREPSRPNSMGRGYCGAGYEEYLLLIEISGTKISLRDQFLLQSCLNSISMRIEHGHDLDDGGNGLTSNDDGSLSYRLIQDAADQERNIAVSAKHFKVIQVAAKDHPIQK